MTFFGTTKGGFFIMRTHASASRKAECLQHAKSSYDFLAYLQSAKENVSVTCDEGAGRDPLSTGVTTPASDKDKVCGRDSPPPRGICSIGINSHKTSSLDNDPVYNKYKTMDSLNKKISKRMLRLMTLDSTPDSIREEFNAMIRNYEPNAFILMNRLTGEKKLVRSLNRYKEPKKYLNNLKYKLKNQVSGLRQAVHITLTIDPQKAEARVPLWVRRLGICAREWMVIVGWEYLDVFKKRVLEERKRYSKKKNRKRLDNNFVAAVMELQQNGFIHFHLIYAGTYVTIRKNLVKYWELGGDKGQGVQYEPHNNLNVVNYLTKYISKGMNSEKYKEAYDAMMPFMWFFGVRWYSIRHNGMNKGGKVKKERVMWEWVLVGTYWYQSKTVTLKETSKLPVDKYPSLEEINVWLGSLPEWVLKL